MIALTTVSSNNEHAKSLIADWATSDDRTQSKSYSSIKRQSDFLLARSALRALLQRTVNIKDCLIRPDIHGKPFVLVEDGKIGPSISLSHTQGLIACAVSLHDPIGVDVEFWHERDYKSIAEYAFGPEEQQEIREEGSSAFYRIWTAREALAKIDGRGIFSTLDGRDQVSKKYLENSARSTQLFHLIPAPHYTLALAIANNSTVKKDVKKEISIITI